MAKLKPIGSEKLEGSDKLQRIMEIANYGMTSNVSESKSDFTINLVDGATYHIIKEKQGYIIKKGINEFSYTLPNSGNLVTFKILTAGDDKKIDAELAGLKKINKDSSPELSTRLKYIITSVNGDREAKTIREFVDNHLLARDSRLLREYIRQVQPDVDLTFTTTSGEEVAIPVNLSFFWPDA